MKFLTVILILSGSIMAFADCGVEGSFEERVASCNKNHKSLKLVMSKQGSNYWFSPRTKSIFQVVAASGWNQALENCKIKKAQLDLPNLYRDWSLSIAQEMSVEITEVYPSLNISQSYEQRYWLGDLFNHPTGKKWAAFYSTKGFIDKWFQDTVGGLYFGGICSVVLK